MHPASALNSTELFDFWVTLKKRGERPIGDEVARQYRFIWNAWIAFITPQGRTWSTADADLLAAFVASRDRRSARSVTTSPATQARYWSVITDVYDKCIAAQLAHGFPEPLNPLAGAIPPENARREVTHSTILPPNHLRRLRKFALSPPASANWTDLRDRILLAVAVETAATNDELAQLCVHQVIGLSIAERDTFIGPPSAAAAADGDPAQHRLDLLPARDGDPQLALALNGPRTSQRRTLFLSQESSTLLRTWLQRRHELASPTPAVFISRKGLASLKSVQIWRTLTALTQEALREVQIKPAHYGSTLVRNSVLLSWLLEGMDCDEVTRRAGLSRVAKLERLIDYADMDTQERFREALGAVTAKQRSIDSTT